MCCVRIIWWIISFSIQPALLLESCVEGDVRLTGDSATLNGTVQVCINGRWGGVCGDANWKQDWFADS